MVFIQVLFHEKSIGALALESDNDHLAIVEAAQDAGLTLRSMTQEEFDNYDDQDSVSLEAFLDDFFECHPSNN
jgi:hypothetical protein